MANAIEMAVSAVIERNLPDLLQRLITNLPPEVVQNIGQMGKIAVSLKAQLDRIENQQRAILDQMSRSAAANTEQGNERPGDHEGLDEHQSNLPVHDAADGRA